ncbi:MAG: alpha-glucosidase C-terminal domain-containing protein, partial [Anaerolineae bacterium]|nr:alpha-glucosidase C-terminal domain-containing protein [Anaerolineae bacterium]
GARMASRCGGQPQARLAGLMLLTLRGTPTVYNGDELGIENGKIPPEKIQDPQGINLGAERTRDVCRTPMQWDASPYAGFSTVEPWLPVSDDYQTRNVAVQSKDPNAMLSFYRRLFWLRKGSPALVGGSYRALEAGAQQNCYAYLREAPEQRVLVALNFGDQPQTLETGLSGAGKVLIGTHGDAPASLALERISLRPFEGLVIEL